MRISKLSQMPKEPRSIISKKLYGVSYFEAGRRLRNRSLPSVNEDFETEPDAEIATQDNFYLIFTILIIDLSAAFRVGSSISTSGDSFSRQERIFSNVTIFI